MAVIEGAPKRARNVRILAAGGTISMTELSGGGAGSATPDLDADALVASIPGLDGDGLEVSTLSNLPSAHLSLEDQLRICRAARDFARRGVGVVVTHGTDTMEETAMLCDVLHDAEAPIVFTGRDPPRLGAGRRRAGEHASTRSRSPPARRPPGWACCSASAARSTTPAACARPTPPRWSPSPRPQTGPLGRVSEGHPTIWSRMPRNPPLDPPHLDRRVVIVPTASGDDGTLARAALATEPDGAVIGTLGAGHLNPDLLELWQDAAERIPVVAYCRSERGVILNATYGYRGSEQDLRASGIIPAGFLSPQAARMKLLACLASGLSIDEVRWAFRQDDG